MHSNGKQHNGRRKDKNRTIVLEILPTGEILIPRDDDLCLELAKSFKDKTAIQFCEQKKLTKVLIGKRMCG